MSATPKPSAPNPAPLPGSRPIKVLVYGVTGALKSTFAATFPKPILVSCFDPWQKEGPYTRLGTSQGIKQTSDGLPFQEVLSADGALVCRIEHFIDANPSKPAALGMFRKRHAEIFDSGEIRQYATYVLDSVTFLDQLAMSESEFLINKGAGNDAGMMHARYSRFELQKILQGRIVGYPPVVNVMVIAHVASRWREELKKGIGKVKELPENLAKTYWRYDPALTGQLKDRVPSGFAELYHAYHTAGGEAGKVGVKLQTQPDTEYNANSQIPAPNNCDPTYAALWANVSKS